MSDVIEKMAKGIYVQSDLIGQRTPWSELPDEHKVYFRNGAQAALAILEQEGWQRVPEGSVVVPKEPCWTEEQKLLRSIRIPDAPANDGAD